MQWHAFFVNCFVSVFAIVDPFGLIPVVLSLTDRMDAAQRSQTIRKACTYAGLVLLVFAFSGMAVFNVFGITMPAFQIAGGILLIRVGISQLSADTHRTTPQEDDEGLHRADVSVFPLATPLLAGPGAISAVVLQYSKVRNDLTTDAWWGKLMASGLLGMAVVGTLIATFFILKAAPWLYRLLGQTGINLLSRLMGLVLTALAVQFMVDGITHVTESLKNILVP